MQSMQMFVMLTLVVFSMIADGCGARGPEPRLRLIGEFWSNASLTDLRQCTSLERSSFTSVYDKRIDSSARRPFYHEERLRLEQYSDLGESGALELDFINDRLVSTMFYPDSLEKYLERFGRISGIHLTEEGVDIGDLFLAVRSSPNGGDFVMWRDMRLERYAQNLASYND